MSTSVFQTQKPAKPKKPAKAPKARPSAGEKTGTAPRSPKNSPQKRTSPASSAASSKAPSKTKEGAAKPKRKRPADVKLPPNAQGLPSAAQAVFRKAVAEDGMAAGWREVKKQFEKGEDGKWRKK